VIGLYFDGFLVSESFGFRYVIPWAKNSGNVLGSLINPLMMNWSNIEKWRNLLKIGTIVLLSILKYCAKFKKI
jgi:hypothetical protein